MNKIVPNKNLSFLLLSLLLIGLILLINQATMIRILLLFIALIGITYYCYKEKKCSKRNIPFLLFFLLLASILCDSILSYSLKRIPIFSYNITTTANTRVYNAVGIKVWQCDKEDYKNLLVAPFYENGYLCNASHLKAMDTNDFFKTIIENYEDYKDTSIKLKGRMSKKGALNYIEFAPSEEEQGEITFADDILLSVFFKKEEEELINVEEKEEITIIGTVKNRELSTNGYIIYIYDAELVKDE